MFFSDDLQTEGICLTNPPICRLRKYTGDVVSLSISQCRDVYSFCLPSRLRTSRLSLSLAFLDERKSSRTIERIEQSTKTSRVRQSLRDIISNYPRSFDISACIIRPMTGRRRRSGRKSRNSAVVGGCGHISRQRPL